MASHKEKCSAAAEGRTRKNSSARDPLLADARARLTCLLAVKARLDAKAKSKPSEEDDPVVRFATKRLCAWLDEQMFEYTTTELGPVTLISSQVETADGIVDTFPLGVEVSHDFVEFTANVPGHVPERFRDDAVSYLSHVNWLLKIGAFVIDTDDGEVGLRLTTTVSAVMADVAHEMEWILATATRELQKYASGVIELSLGLEPHVLALNEPAKNGADDANEMAGERTEASEAGHKQTAADDVQLGCCRKPVIPKSFTISALNVVGDVKPEQVIRAAKKFVAMAEPDRMGLHVSLAGPSGTGKSLFAAVVADSVGAELMTVTASDVLDPYVGGSEKRIKAIFRKAEERKAVLLLDEVDAILSSRANAQFSWQRSSVCELLVRLAEFNGLCLIATNHLEVLDPAVQRRILFKLTFDYLGSKGKVELFGRYFGKKLSRQDCERLDGIGYLVPSDFEVASTKMRWLETSTNVGDCLSALEAEVAAKGIKKASKIGF